MYKSISSVNCSNHLSTATNKFLQLSIMMYDKTAYWYTRGFCVIARLSNNYMEGSGSLIILSIFDNKQECITS